MSSMIFISELWNFENKSKGSLKRSEFTKWLLSMILRSKQWKERRSS